MIDLRHHIYSLVAVFLALGMGMVIGICLAPGDSDAKAVQKRQLEIRRLEQSFGVLRDEIANKQQTIDGLKERVDTAEQVGRELLPIVVKGRLAYRNVAIIQTGGSDEAVAAARSALEKAGAKVTCSIRILDGMAKDSGSGVQILADCARELGLKSGLSEGDYVTALLSAIADAVVWAKKADSVISTLKKNDLITISGSVDRWNRLVVVVGGAVSNQEDHTDLFDLPLLEMLKERRTEVVGCEALEAPVSSVAAYAGKGVSTVDNIDTAAGQISLIYALSGEPGHYGVKRTADRILPKSLEREGI